MGDVSAEPYFTLPLKNQYADHSSTLTWRCEAGGKPDVQYFWLRDGKELTNTTIPPADRARFAVNNNVLTVQTLQPQDNGMYQCSARNIHARRHSAGELRVLAFKPNFAKYPLLPNQYGTVNGNTTLLCRPEAAPYPMLENIVWYKNRVPMNPGSDENSRIRKLPNGNLFMNRLVMQDSGVYMCKVRNQLGEANTTGNLTILSRCLTAACSCCAL